MSEYTHCGHGIAYTDECAECDRIWAESVTLPDARELIAKLLRFYSVDDLRQLIFEQDKHIEKLQSKVPPIADSWPRNYRQG